MPRQINVSHFIDNLNSFDNSVDASNTSLNDSVTQGHPQEEDLSIFSNTHFFDFDMGCSTDISVSVDDLLMQQEKQLQSKASEVLPVASSSNTSSPSEFQLDNFDFGLSAQLDNIQQYSLANELLPADNFITPPAPTGSKRKLAPALPGQGRQNSIPALPSTQNKVSPVESGIKKRKMSVASPAVAEASPAFSETSPDLSNMDESQRSVAEEDKRRRNTAASARFRVKKKMREQQMERAAKELQEKVLTLETKVMQLEMENKWLKNLVVEKNEARDISDLHTMKSKILSGVKTESGDSN